MLKKCLHPNDPHTLPRKTSRDTPVFHEKPTPMPERLYQELRDRDEEFHKVNVDLMYKLLSLLVLSIFVPALTVMIMACIGIDLSHRQMVWLLIFSVGCPFVAIMVVICLILWRFECEKMQRYRSGGV